MNATVLKRLRANDSGAPAPARLRHRKRALIAPYRKRWFHRLRRRHDPMLVFNMSIFNSAKIRQCIFNSFPQRENV
jgi:hypothetical protein